MKDMAREAFMDACVRQAMKTVIAESINAKKIIHDAAVLVHARYSDAKMGELLDAFFRVGKADDEVSTSMASVERIFERYGDATKPEEPFRDVCARAAAAGDAEAIAWSRMV
jgi:hypothetical protein